MRKTSKTINKKKDLRYCSHRRLYETRTRTYLFMEARIGRDQTEALNLKINRDSTYKKWTSQQAGSLDGDEIAAANYLISVLRRDFKDQVQILVMPPEVECHQG